MLKNILFGVLLLLGIWVTQSSIPLGIIYNFCIILIFNYFYVFEGFETCNFNIPTSIVSDEPIIIPLEGSTSEYSEEEGQTLTVSSSNNTFTFGLDIPELPTKLKVGDQIRINGAQVNSSALFTVIDVTTNSFRVQEPIGEDYYLTQGVIRINFELITSSNTSVIYNKKLMKKQVSQIDQHTSSNDTYFEEVADLRDIINEANETIQTETKKITQYQNKIEDNQSTIYSNNSIIQNRTDLVSFLNQAVANEVTPDTDYEKDFNQKYIKLGKKNIKIEESINYLNYQIMTSKDKIKKAYQTKCRSRQKIERLMTKINQNNRHSQVLNNSLITQNNNFDEFMNSCTVPPAPVNHFSSFSPPKKKCE